MHHGYLDPATRSQLVHLKIISAVAKPEAWVFAIKFREWKFREAASWMLEVMGVVRSWVARS